MKPQLIIEQKITAMANKYKVFDGQHQSMHAFAQQKRLAFKEKVTFYADEQKTREIFTLRAEKVMDVHGRYLVEDENGQLVGVFKKEFKKSLFNSTWLLLDSEGNTIYTVRESNQVVATLRRFIDFIPIIGEIGDIVMAFFRYHFQFIDANGQEAGKYVKTTLFRDHYRLEMRDVDFAKVDWRVMTAFTVALDALQSR